MKCAPGFLSLVFIWTFFAFCCSFWLFVPTKNHNEQCDVQIEQPQPFAICKNKNEQRKGAQNNERQMETRPKNKNEQQKAANSYTDDIIILLNFIFTSLHGYQITPGLSAYKKGTTFCC